MIALHAERVAADPQAIRWVLPAGTLPVGRVLHAPGTIGGQLDDGTLSGALVENSALWLWLRDGLSWGEHGRLIQAPLRDALADPGGWLIDPAPGEVLLRVTTDVLDGSAGDFIRSHGGAVTATRQGDTDVVVKLGGACEHCAAAEYTLRMRLLGELRRRCPDIVEVDNGGGRLTLALGDPD